MGLRDIVLLIAIYGSIPFILRKPFVGVLVWYWLSLMNPHRISWTLENQPFAYVIALTTLISLLIAKNEKKEIPWTPITITLALYWAWMLVTTVFALYPQLAWHQWDKVWKIMLTTFAAMLLLNSKQRIVALTAVSAFSVGFYGFKGGFFTLATGGSNRVWGPPGSFLGGNNEVGLALVMTVPLLFFLRTLSPAKAYRSILLAGIILCVFAILGTQSRGAFLGVAAIGLFLALKSPRRLQYLLLIALLTPTAFLFMPDSWHERMATIETYQQDGSAMGRLTAWHMAYNSALERPFGGGFEMFKPPTYLMYLPEAGGRGTDAHSIYFETLGEHGFIGLGLFLALGIFAWRTCSGIIRQTRDLPDMVWMRNLAAMLQVSLVGYAVSGAFLGLSYFDYYYALLAIIVGMRLILDRHSPQPDAASVEKPLVALSKKQLNVGARARGRERPVAAFVRRWYQSL
jgi:probable O-glycosylation ligase (exosortase A-associated)